MKVRILEDGAVVNRKARKKGDTLMVEQPDAISLAKNGIVEIVPEPRKAEAAKVDTPATAATGPARSRGRGTGD